MRAFLFFILTSMIFFLASACHYSCATCSGSYYTHCLSCLDPTRTPTIPISCSNTNDQKLVSQKGGICGNGGGVGVNALGITLIMLAVTSSIWLQSHYVLSFLISFQTIGLISLIQTDFPPSLDYMLSSMQYFMLFSTAKHDSKPSNCKLLLRGMYRLNDFLGTSDFRQNSIPIFPIVIIVASLLAFASLLTKYRKSKLNLMEERTKDTILVGLRAFLFFTMQEGVLVTYVGIRLGGLDGGQMLLIGICWATMIYLIVDCSFHMSKELFGSTAAMVSSFTKRLVLPALVVLPFNYTYLLIIFMIGFSAIDMLLFMKAKKARMKSVVYQGIELVYLAIIGVFLFADLSRNSAGQAQTLGIFGSVFLTIYLIFFLVEIITGVRKKLVGKQVINSVLLGRKNQLSEKNSASREHDTLSDLYSNQQERETKVTPAQPARKASEDLKVSKQRIQDVRIEDFT